MNPRTYKPGKGGTIRRSLAPSPVKLHKDKPKAKRRSGGPKEQHELLADATVAAARALAQSGIFKAYDDVRKAVMQGFAEAFAASRDMPALPIDRHLSLVRLDLRFAFCDAVRSVGDYSTLDIEHWGHVHENLAGWRLDGAELVWSSERRHGGVHFTPRSLTEPIVRRTLEPIFDAQETDSTWGRGPRVLDLRVCDPSVGAGAFLLEAVRQLAQRMLDRGEEKDLMVAKRLAAVHCCYGVDISRWAVAAAKIALQIECRAHAMPSTWLDDNIKVGDSLVGLTDEQARAFHWSPSCRKKPATLFEVEQAKAIAEHYDRAIALGADARRERMAKLAELARGAA